MRFFKALKALDVKAFWANDPGLSTGYEERRKARPMDVRGSRPIRHNIHAKTVTWRAFSAQLSSLPTRMSQIC